MEIDTSKELVSINKSVSEKKELIFIEDNIIIPDSKPDILNAINLSGNVCTYKKEVFDEKVKIDGCINTYIMYLPDSKENNLRGLNAEIDFSKIFQIPEAKEGMNLIVNSMIKSLECKVLNGRKVSVKIGLEISIKIYSNDEIEVITEINNIPDIQLLKKELELNSVIGNGSSVIYVKDTLNLDTKDEFLEILKCNISLINNDMKLSYNKVISKCDADVNIMFLTTDGRVCEVNGKIPAVAFIDMPNISEEKICEVINEINNIVIRPNSVEEHSIYVEVEIETKSISYEKKKMSLIQDLYSIEKNINFNNKMVNAIAEKICKNKKFSITSKINVANILDENLLDVEVTSTINSTKIFNTKVNYEGELNLNFVYVNDLKAVNNKTAKIPFEISIENILNDENVNVEDIIDVIEKRFSIKSNGDIECNIDLEIKATFSKNIKISIIENLNISDEVAKEMINNPYNSLIMYIIQPRDTLWKIAKKFRSTVDEIKILNNLDENTILQVGEKVYIPKYRKVAHV